MAQAETFTLDFKFGGNTEFLAKLESLMRRVDERFDVLEDNFENTNREVKELGDSFDEIAPSMERFGSRISNLTSRLQYLVSSWVSVYSLRRMWDFGMESMGISSTQEHGERQLKNVLHNMGTEDSYDELKAAASSIQQRTLYGDEVMIGAAGELSTYMKDPEALKAMMGVLADYAAGMTGGGEVGYDQMVSFATGLGMAYDGNYRSLNMRGFDTTALKKLDKKEAAGGKVTEMDRVKALQESLETWNGMAEDMAKTGDAAFIQFKNKLGDLREEMGQKLFPVFNKLVAALDAHLPQIQTMFDGLATSFDSMATAISENLDDIVSFGESLAEWVPKIVDLALSLASFVEQTVGFKNVFAGLVGLMAVNKISGFVSAFKEFVATMNSGTSAMMNAANASSRWVEEFSKVDKGLGGLRDGVNKLGSTAVGSAGLIVAAIGSISMAWDAISKEWEGYKTVKANDEKLSANNEAFDNLAKIKKQFKEGSLSEATYKNWYERTEKKLGRSLKGTAYDIWNEIKKERKSAVRKPDVNTMNVNLTADIDKVGLLLNANMRRLIERQVKLNYETSIVTEVG